MIKMNKVFALFAAFFITSCLLFIPESNITHAAPVTGFEPGNIISDSTFTDHNSMTVAQIQNFLNSKVPYCDEQGLQPSEYGGGTRAQWAAARGHYPPFTCLRNYSQNGKSAAQIIYDVAQEFRVNPQVFIVLLQKEQGLVTDEWPLSTQYRTATGYGCPDTAPCDSEYFGFTNQLRWSGRMFRSILDRSPSWYAPYSVGTNTVYWHPDLVRCGSSQVNIINLSTAALYSYTPYRPNQAALNAGYGMGDSCSSYGNRNFYQYFKDWFGSPTLSYAAEMVSNSLYSDSDYTNQITSSVRGTSKLFVEVRARNVGSTTWNRSFMRVGTRSPQNHASQFTAPSWPSSGRAAILIENSVPPGEVGTFRFEMINPKINGGYVEKFQLVAEGRAWLSERSRFDVGFEINNPYDAGIISVQYYSDDNFSTRQRFPVEAGSDIYVSVNLKNTGSLAWPANTTRIGTADPFNRSSPLYDETWFATNRPVQNIDTVDPNESTTLQFKIHADSEVAEYNEAFAMVVDGHSWMPGSGFESKFRSTDNTRTLMQGERLLATGETLYGSSSLRLILQGDGNLVLYSSAGKALWNSGTRD